MAFQKKMLIKSGFILFAVILLAYIYLVGGVVSGSAKLKKMDILRQKEMSGLEAVESKMLSENRDLNISYFLGQGYEEPKNLDVIKRKPNVAKNSLSYFY